nr:ribokinase [Paenibacillus solanacearum]
MGIIAVVGSINIDIVNRVQEYPVPGQTIKSEGTEYNYGGKGANQAVAAARSGGRTMMAGAVGSDSFGGELLEALRREGIDTKRVDRKSGNSGMAFITVDASGQNQIILSEGANGSVVPEDVKPLWAMPDVAAVLLQNEIPWETNRSVLRQARAAGIRVTFNPAPALPIPDDVLALIDTLIVNESEAEFISGRTVGSRAEAETAARALLDRGAGEVIVTLGSQGALYMARSGDSFYTPAYPVKAVDTTAAGDTFIGAYTAQVCEGSPIPEALRFASAAAALTVMRSGAQSSIPTREEIASFLQANS